jgi:glutathione peroxidase
MNHAMRFVLAIVLTLPVTIFAQTEEKIMEQQPKLYSFSMKTIDGKDKPLSEYKGKVLLIVNVASKCGNTPQYKGLESIYEKYKDRGFVILGFPANNFLWQEPGTNDEIKKFCTLNYNVTFDMFSKISVKGSDQDSLYQYLTKESPVPGAVTWNFQKYLVDRKGNVVEKFTPKTGPEEKEVIDKIEQLLSEK